MSGASSSSQQNDAIKSDVKFIVVAANEGNRDELTRLLGMLPVGSSSVNEVISDAWNIAMMEYPQTVKQFAGSIQLMVLNTLIAKQHSTIALTFVQNDNYSILRETNERGQTPLHIAAIEGNEEFISELIRAAPDVVKEVLRKKDKEHDIPLHEAVRNKREEVVRALMKFDPKGAYEENKKEVTPLDIAIGGRCNDIAKMMVQEYRHLVYHAHQHQQGFPLVHVAAQMGNIELLIYSIKEYPGSAYWVDYYRRNLFHIAALKDNTEVITEVLALDEDNLIAGMIHEASQLGNTPLHLAAMKGHKSVMKAIWKRMDRDKEQTHNHQGHTPFDLSEIQVKKTTKDMQERITEYVGRKGRKFSSEWFDDIMEPPYENEWERTQVIGLGSVLITTVAFAVAFTVPGGFDQDNGTPVLGRRYFFRAFMVANALAFIQAVTSLFTLILGALRGTNNTDLRFATFTFRSAASCMVVAFGLGSFVMLYHIRRRMAYLILVLTLLLGSPAAIFLIFVQQQLFSLASNGMSTFKRGFSTDRYSSVVRSFSRELRDPLFMLALYGIPLLLIFGLAFL